MIKLTESPSPINAYRREEFEQLLERAGRTSVVEVNYEHAEDRISGIERHFANICRRQIRQKLIRKDDVVRRIA